MAAYELLRHDEQARIKSLDRSITYAQVQILPGRGTEAARLSIVTLTGDGRGGGLPSVMLTHLDAPAAGPQQR